MDKKTAPVVDIPDFKLKKVGKEREKRRTGMPWFPQVGRTAQGALATGGRGAIASFFASKIGLMAIMAVLTAGSWGLGKVLADANQSEGRNLSKPTGGTEKVNYDGDLKNLPGSEGSGKSGLGMVSGSLSAPKAPDAEASDAAADSGAAGDAAAAGDAPAAGDAAAGEAPAADAAPAAGPSGKASAFGGRIGGLSAGLSGLSGGGGLSGGINRNFGTAPKFDANKLTSMRGGAKTNKTTAARTSIRDSASRGLARRQLSTAHQFGRAARKGGDENRSTNASAAFDNTAPAGIALTGAGAAEGAPPASGAPDMGGVSGGGVGGSTGGDSGVPAITCGRGTHLSADKTTCVASASHKDPAEPIMKFVMILTYLLVALLLLQALSHYMEWTGFNRILTIIIGIVSAALFGLGVALLAMGRPALGAAAVITGGCGLIFAIQGDKGETIGKTTLTYMGLVAFLGAAMMSMGGDKWDKKATQQDFD